MLFVASFPSCDSWAPRDDAPRFSIVERRETTLLALALCEPGEIYSFTWLHYSTTIDSILDMKSDASEQLLLLLDDIRSKTLRELHRYYIVDMKLTDFSTRLSNLMIVCDAVRVRMNTIYDFIFNALPFSGIQHSLSRVLPHSCSTFTLLPNWCRSWFCSCFLYE